MLKNCAFLSIVIVMMLSLIACDSTPGASTTSSTNTYKVIFPFKEPETLDESYVYEHNDVVTYMNWVRAKDNYELAESLANALVGDMTSILDIVEVAQYSLELTPYIPLEDVRTFQMAHPELSQETYVPAEPIYYQEDASGNLILLRDSGFLGIVLPEEEELESKIAFQSNRDGRYQIYVMNADGTEQTRLTINSSNDSEPSWSPDGQKIAFVSQRDGNREIYVMNADGTGQTRLTTNPGRDDNPSWSPDGKKIVFQSYRDVNWEIYVINADGTGLTRLTNNIAEDYAPSWSPDGQKITFESLRDWQNIEIYVMNLCYEC